MDATQAAEARRDVKPGAAGARDDSVRQARFQAERPSLESVRCLFVLITIDRVNDSAAALLSYDSLLYQSLGSIWQMEVTMNDGSQGSIALANFSLLTFTGLGISIIESVSSMASKLVGSINLPRSLPIPPFQSPPTLLDRNPTMLIDRDLEILRPFISKTLALCRSFSLDLALGLSCAISTLHPLISCTGSVI